MHIRLGFLLSVVLLTHVVHAQKLEFTNPDGMPPPERYTHVARVGNLIFLSGQVGLDAEGRIVGSSMREQYEQALINITTALKSQGADITNIAKITTFVTSISEYGSPEVVAIRTKYFRNHKPASTLVQISQLARPAYKVEVEAIAVLP